MANKQNASQPKALTSRDRDYLAKTLSTTTEFRQLSTEWKTCNIQGLAALKSARTSMVRAIEELTAAVDQIQDIVVRMNRIRRKLINIIQQASPPGIMGIDATLKAQEEARIAAEIEKQKGESRVDSDIDSDSSLDECSSKEDPVSPTVTPIRGYVPPPELVHTVIPGTKSTPLAMSGYIDHVLEQALDEIGLKNSILEALHTIAAAKDSGEDELPALLDQQLTNMILLWELEPYLETVPERNQIEEALGVVSWQMENVK